MSDESALQNFKVFEETFQNLSLSLQRKITSIAQFAKDPESLSAVVQEAEQEAYDADQCIKNIERDVRHYPFNLKTKCQQRLQTLQAKLDEQKEELRRRARGGGNDVNGAPANISRADRSNWKEQRTRLLGAKEIVDSTSESLDRTMGAIEETTETGKQTATQLQTQRELMKNARDNLRDADDFLSRSRNTLLRMRRRVVTNKLISGLIILLEIGLIGLVIYLKYYR